MELGTPLPADLGEITHNAVQRTYSPDAEAALIARLHIDHHRYDYEIADLHDKQLAIKNVLDQLYRNRDQRTLAGFDQKIGGR